MLVNHVIAPSPEGRHREGVPRVDRPGRRSDEDRSARALRGRVRENAEGVAVQVAASRPVVETGSNLAGIPAMIRALAVPVTALAVVTGVGQILAQQGQPAAVADRGDLQVLPVDRATSTCSQDQAGTSPFRPAKTGCCWSTRCPRRWRRVSPPKPGNCRHCPSATSSIPVLTPITLAATPLWGRWAPPEPRR